MTNIYTLLCSNSEHTYLLKWKNNLVGWKLTNCH